MKKIILSLFIATSAQTFAQNREAQFDSLFTHAHAAGQFNGNVLIAEKGTIIFEKSYGLANESTQEPLTAESVFELASVSKQFTAMGIVLLQKQGKLSYADPISKYLPELGFYGNITIRNLLNHTGGLPDYMDFFETHWDKQKFAVNSDIVAEFARHKPAALFQPNEKFEYSNTGYALLASIIEIASGQSYGDFLQTNIFKPLHMEHTSVYRSRYQPKTIPNYAVGYISDSLGQKIQPDALGKQFYTYYLDGIVGDGMVNATTGDLLKWDRALYTNALISKKDRKLIFSAARTKDGQDSGYGFGWMIGDHPTYGKIVGHSGSWAGYINYIDRHLESDKTIIMLQNNALPTTEIPTKEVRSILYGEPQANSLKIRTVRPADLEQYLGVYAHPKLPIKITVTQKDAVLMAQASGQSAFPLDAYEDHTFLFNPAEIRIVFHPADKTMVMYQGGGEFKFTREL